MVRFSIAGDQQRVLDVIKDQPFVREAAAANPLLYAVDAARHIFNDNLGDPSVAKGVLILAVLSVVAVVIGARQFGRAVA